MPTACAATLRQQTLPVEVASTSAAGLVAAAVAVQMPAASPHAQPPTQL
jgi:hypothetical protein